MPDLPVDIDTTYPDNADRPDRKLHQQHHDALHARYNEENAAGTLDGQTTSDTTSLGVGSYRELPTTFGNVVVGQDAAADLAEGANSNSALGKAALYGIVNGTNNVGVGDFASPDPDASYTTIVGSNAYGFGNNMVAVGAGAGGAGGSVNVGQNAQSSGANAVAVGSGISAAGANAVVVGRAAGGSTDSVAIGAGASAGAGAVAVGKNVSSSAGEIRLAHVRFGHAAGGVWTVEIDGTAYTIAVTPA